MDDIDIDFDAEDDFVFEDELSSNIGSSMTILDEVTATGNSEGGVAETEIAANKSTGRSGLARDHYRSSSGSGNRRRSVRRKSKRSVENTSERMPLIRKLFTLALYRRHHHPHPDKEANPNPRSGQMEMVRRRRASGRQSRNENKLTSGKKGWWVLLAACSLPFIS